MTRYVRLSLASTLIGLLLAVPLSAQQSEEQVYRVLPRDAIPAIDNPTFDRVDEADRYFANDELVIGLVGAYEQRAYSTWQLDTHEIVNDTFEGQPIAVTW